MTNTEKHNLIDQYIDAYNSFDIEKIMAVIHPKIEFKNISNGKVNASASGVEEFRQMAEEAKKLFITRKQTVTAFSIEDGKTTININYVGVLAADLPNGLKAGETLRLEGRSEFNFKDGKICSILDFS